MLSWFTRNRNAPRTPPPHSVEQGQEALQTAVAPSAVPEEKPTAHDLSHLAVPSPAALSVPPATTALTSEQPQRNTFKAALNTPHDAVLAELHGHHPAQDPSAPIEATPSPSALGMQSIDTLPAAASDAPTSVAASSSPLSEPLYDPFTGATIGALSPTSSANQSSEALWAHLGRIRSLQADVARLHVTMEGIGLGESVLPQHLRNPGPRPVGERLEEDDEENSDGDGASEAEKRRAREFERYERRFDGRKEEIGQIMAKLDELSQALGAFHALDTPMFNAAAAASPSTTASTTPAPRRPSFRHSDLHRVSVEGSTTRGREGIFDSPASIQEPLPHFEEPEGSRVDPLRPETSAHKFEKGSAILRAATVPHRPRGVVPFSLLQNPHTSDEATLIVLIFVGDSAEG
ncbi:hypothetical protein BC826DRAFT_569 [Russula brevipes]|nr:hypothetical protein BC826DRAFT_569 [Russula brevipes]